MKSFFILLVLLSANVLWAARLEVVQSVPVETTLEVPGIRHSQEVWLEIIGNAKVTLDIEQMYLSEQAGEALTPVLKAIEEAGKRGVKVRLIADKKFYKTYPESIDFIDKTVNSEARIADFSATGGIQHAKYFIADGQVTFVGSQNFDWRALSHIHEIGLRIDDKAVAAQLKKVFEKDWAAGGAVGNTSPIGSLDVEPMKAIVTVVASPKSLNPAGVGDSLKAILSLIDKARKSVRVQVMDYSVKGAKAAAPTWLELDNALRHAGERGVRVELLIDIGHYKTSKKELDALAQSKNVVVKTVKIPLWSGGEIPYARLIHSKYLIADRAKAWVGTENWTEGYFANTRNVGIVTDDTEVVSKLGQVFERVSTSAYAVDLK